MKIRTDFVTNSSSSSFVTLKIKSDKLAKIFEKYSDEMNGEVSVKGKTVTIGCQNANEEVAIFGVDCPLWGCHQKIQDRIDAGEKICYVIYDEFLEIMEDFICELEDLGLIEDSAIYEELKKNEIILSHSVESLEYVEKNRYWDEFDEPDNEYLFKYDGKKGTFYYEDVQDDDEDYDDEDYDDEDENLLVAYRITNKELADFVIQLIGTDNSHNISLNDGWGWLSVISSINGCDEIQIVFEAMQLSEYLNRTQITDAKSINTQKDVESAILLFFEGISSENKQQLKEIWNTKPVKVSTAVTTAMIDGEEFVPCDDDFAAEYLYLYGEQYTDLNTVDASKIVLSLTSDTDEIKRNTFSGFSFLTDIKIPDHIRIIGDAAFASFKNLRSVSIPKNVTEIGAETFGNCLSLTTIIIPDSVIEIGLGAFKNCENLSEVSIGKNAHFAGAIVNALHGCSKIEKIAVSSENPYYTVIDGAIYDKSVTTLYYVSPMTDYLHLPDTVEKIDENALSYMNKTLKIALGKAFINAILSKENTVQNESDSNEIYVTGAVYIKINIISQKLIDKIKSKLHVVIMRDMENLFNTMSVGVYTEDESTLIALMDLRDSDTFAPMMDRGILSFEECVLNLEENLLVGKFTYQLLEFAEDRWYTYEDLKIIMEYVNTGRIKLVNDNRPLHIIGNRVSYLMKDSYNYKRISVLYRMEKMRDGEMYGSDYCEDLFIVKNKDISSGRIENMTLDEKQLALEYINQYRVAYNMPALELELKGDN